MKRKLRVNIKRGTELALVTSAKYSQPIEGRNISTSDIKLVTAALIYYQM